MVASFSAVACSPPGQTQAAKSTAKTEAAQKHKLKTLTNNVQNKTLFLRQFAFMQHYTAVAGILGTKTYETNQCGKSQYVLQSKNTVFYAAKPIFPLRFPRKYHCFIFF